MNLNFLDLFSGAGGLSEGFIRAGFNPISHVEIDEHASKSLETRVMYHHLKKEGKLSKYRMYQKSYYLNDWRERASERDKLKKYVPSELLDSVINLGIGDDTLNEIFNRIDRQLEVLREKKIHLIIGGPPCQAYSVIGRSRDRFGMVFDNRNYLYLHYVEFLKKYKPMCFVFENVLGLKTAQQGAIYKDLREKLTGAGYNVQFNEVNAADFGVPQSRKRIIIVGWKNNLEQHELPSEVIENKTMIRRILADLPELEAGQNWNSDKYNSYTNKDLKKLSLRNKGEVLTHHNARPHNQRDLDIYRRVVDLWDREERRLRYNDLPENLKTHQKQNVFLDRFKVVAGNRVKSHTVVAHIAKDGHHYIHPELDQNRSLTVREAARLQTFSDDYFFEGSRSAAYKQIGNAVPPVMAENIAKWIMRMMSMEGPDE